MAIPEVIVTTARIYASQVYHKISGSICPGGTDHEGNGASAVYCDACLRNLIADAWTAGNLARWTHGRVGSKG